MQLIEIIKKIREYEQLSQESLAKKLGVSFTSVNRWENGKTVPRKGVIRKLEKMYHATQNKRTKISAPRHRRPVAYCLFAGAGGLHLGLEQAGFNVLVATDNEPTAEATHKANWPAIPFLLDDIRRVDAGQLLELARGRKPDLVAGGPPCQGFSTLGDKLSSDPRNDLFEAYARLVEKLEPKCILIENVKALTTMYGGRYAENIVRRFAEMGYAMHKTILNAADYGVPQTRFRTFIFGTRLNHAFSFPRPSHGSDQTQKPIVTVGQSIMDLATKSEEQVENHIALKHSEKVIERYKLIPEGGRLPPPEQLPKEIRRKNFGNTYKRLDRSKPALTMVPGNNAFPVHPTLNRSLTPREAARLQTFPDEFVFIGDRRRQCIQVGNAVPVMLARMIAERIIQHIRKKIPKSEAATPEELIVCSHSGTSKLEWRLRLQQLKEKQKNGTFIDLFCGAGGFTIGLARSGFLPLLCADNSRVVAQTHEYNYPNVPFLEADLSDACAQEQIASHSKGKEVSAVVGGPPCQGFSIFGKRRFVNTRGYDPHKDPRNKLVYAFIETVRTVNPRWFVMENVPGLANLDQGLFLKALLEEFRGIGYKNAQARVLNAADYGVPQLRKRLLIIGNRTGHIIPWPKRKFFAEPKEWQGYFRTVGEVISDLAVDEAGDRVTCHVPMKHKPLLVERYGYIPEGGKLDVSSLPQHLKKGYRTDKVKNYSHVFKRLHRDKPSITMVPGHNAFPIHPWLNRALTVREAARIQTFPDEIEFKGSRQDQCIQVGNAFPPLLAELIGNNIVKAEKNDWFPGNVPASAFYALVENNPSDLLHCDDLLVSKGMSV